MVDVPETSPVFAVFNYPNPFNPRTIIAFDLPQPAFVDLKICDVSGRLVRTALAGEWMSAGRREWTWNGTDDRGRNVATGMYLYGVRAGSHAATGRMTLVR